MPSCASSPRTDPRRLGGGRRGIGLVAALAGGVFLSVAAARWIEGVLAQALARSGPARSETPARSPAGVPLPALPLRPFPPPQEAPLPAPAPGEVVGRIRIPRVGIDLAVFEGVTADVLRKGPGHVPGTALPASGSNCVISAHRDSFFRRLADVRIGDSVYVSGANGEREYRLAARRVVSPTEIAVLAPTEDEQVTLLTCYPFQWIGPAPYRVVWQALPAASARGGEAAGPAVVGSR